MDYLATSARFIACSAISRSEALYNCYIFIEKFNVKGWLATSTHVSLPVLQSLDLKLFIIAIIFFIGIN
jgi:hypothetical protein